MHHRRRANISRSAGEPQRAPSLTCVTGASKDATRIFPFVPGLPVCTALQGRWKRLAASGGAILAFVLLSCGGGSGPDPASQNTGDPCNCTPQVPSTTQYRYAAKHVPLPSVTPQEITVNTMLGWPAGPDPPFDALRTGIELQLFHIASAFLQSVHYNREDCDISMQISATADKHAPRVIVETVHMPEYCSVRQQLQAQLSAHGITLGAEQELAQPLPIEVLGLAFQDVGHDRGALVATPWELHPAIVTVTQ